MITVITAIIGFLSPFIPELIKLWGLNNDRKHEREMLRMRLKDNDADRLWRLDRIRVDADAKQDIAETKALRRPPRIMGVALLDAGREWVPIWILVPAFYIFVVVDALVALVRPVITYAAFSGYLAYKWALYQMMLTREGNSVDAILATWGPQDYNLLVLILSFWFGSRMAKKVFGEHQPAR